MSEAKVTAVRVLNVLRENPGATCSDLSAIFRDSRITGDVHNSVRNALLGLESRNQIYSLEEPRKGGFGSKILRYYAKEL